MPKDRPCVLSIAGFDPSGGAGVLADIKTFEQHKVLGMAAVTGITYQNEDEFEGVKWLNSDEIKKQTKLLLPKHKFQFVKIGMLENLDRLEEIVSDSRQQAAGIKIIWDPIIKTSSGFSIHEKFEKEKLISILKNIYLVTPNTDEIKILSGEQDEMVGAKKLSEHCNVFLKGGHSQKSKGKDYLLTTDGKTFSFRPKKISSTGKHGSGCVLSSAITANLALGNNLHRSCLKAKDYVTKILMSNKTLLGFHKI